MARGSGFGKSTSSALAKAAQDHGPGARIFSLPQSPILTAK